MEDLLSQLDINPNADLNELTKQIASVLLFMQIDRYLEPDVNEVRMFLRAALFLNGSLQIHGQTIEQKLQDYQQIPKYELNSILTKFHEESLMDDVCEKLLLTETGPNHILEIQSFCNDFLDQNRYLAILRRVQDIRCSDLNIDETAAEAKFLVTTIFQMKCTSDINIAIKRLLDNVHFNILAWIINYNEPNTFFSMKCLLILRELCSDLEYGLISENFIASMYEYCAQDENSLRTYLKCLQNRFFAKSLMTFCINYLTAIGDDKSHKPERHDIAKHGLLNVSFLIAGILSSKSDCRIAFHKKLSTMSVNVNILLSIGHLNFIYNF